MTIRKRLFVSNLLMILVPVLTALIVGLGCLYSVDKVAENGSSFGIRDNGGFTVASQVVTELAENWLSRKDFDVDTSEVLETALDTVGLTINIYHSDELIYSYGDSVKEDSRLLTAVQTLGKNGSTANVGKRSAYYKQEQVNGEDYDIFIFGSLTQGIDKALKETLIEAAAFLIIAVVLSVVITNHTIIHVIFRNIESPLELLKKGVYEVRDGNLDYRIEYNKDDEFKPYCEAFNEMARGLQEALNRIRKNEESRKELMAGISHDLRSPLTSIRAYVEGLLDEIADTPQSRRKYLLTIQRKAEDIDRMVNQLFTFSKLELNEFPVELRQVRMDYEMKNFYQDYGGDYEEKGLKLAFKQLDSCEVSIDQEQFIRIIRNILDNSAKYKNKPVGTAWISVKAEADKCVLCIADDGPGVAPEAINKLFDAFYRTDPARRNPAGGSGLGLAIAAKTIERMNGRIFAENVPDGGLAVIMELPLEKVVTQDGKDTDH